MPFQRAVLRRHGSSLTPKSRRAHRRLLLLVLLSLLLHERQALPLTVIRRTVPDDLFVSTFHKTNFRFVLKAKGIVVCRRVHVCPGTHRDTSTYTALLRAAQLPPAEEPAGHNATQSHTSQPGHPFFRVSLYSACARVVVPAQPSP